MQNLLMVKKIEFKATSNYEYDLSSFGPKCDFDDLVFFFKRFDLDLNMLFVYDTGVNSEELKRKYQYQKRQQ